MLRSWSPLRFSYFVSLFLLQIGISRAACAEDELMLASVAASAPARVLPIVDCRPRSSATANFAAGRCGLVGRDRTAILAVDDRLVELVSGAPLMNARECTHHPYLFGMVSRSISPHI